ncbi:endonuclease/exonuclease/phosphatase family protein [Mesorhizobium sp. BAC0120]|uniref:endonuclease/exonuclease/phosphatase family protein n=1 Tax=Mesorhizobium sp. BAC0120 TaxID=3090670 RepID=UPI00298BD6DA|nr:endonuclease/exonuclease/phosphatase family protein [Mesorhizobium sp. BAC0120]MDW6021155.1 endonuclease/exonuclease/phosphatase family protein [Mesorhizobium sp. BAC0120]
MHTAATLVFAGATVLSIPLVLGLLANLHPAFDSFAHFRAHLAALLGICGLILLASIYWKQGLLAVALGVLALWTTMPAFPLFGATSAAAGDAANGRAVYRLLQLNLRFDNKASEKVLSLIGRTKPDVITLEEVSVDWMPRIAAIAAMYPYSIVCDAPNRIGGNAVLSRRPFLDGAPGRCLNEGALALADIDFGGRSLQVAALHLAWPWPSHQSEQLQELRPDLAALGNTALLAGDLNAATWSATVRRVEADAGLSHVAGIGPTWLDRRLPDVLRPYIGLPIDQVFSKGDISILSARALDAVGSDHLPVLVEFAFSGGKLPQDNEESATASAETRKSVF